MPLRIRWQKNDTLVIPLQPKKKIGLDYIMGNKWILLGIIAVILIILIILIVGISVSRRSVEPEPETIVITYDDPVAFNVQCGEATGDWELNHTVAVFKVWWAISKISL